MTEPESTLPGEAPPDAMTASDVRAADAESPREPVPVLAAGTKLEGTYEVKRLLGRGAMGAVYLVEHVGLGKEFAAKVVSGHRAMDGALVARLRNEARITSSIEHENIVNVTHLGQIGDGSVFVVMELLRGENLRERLVRQAARASEPGHHRWLPDDEVDAIVRAVLSALAAAHTAGVVHRDLKPDNVFLAELRSGKRVPKIVDFGIGKLRKPDPRGDDMRLTETGQIVGTPLYMAPEQMRSTSDVDPRADLYSLGVIVFEMLTGRVPFEAHSLYDLAIKHATEKPPALATLRPDLDGAVVDVVMRCLEKDVDARWPSADTMLAAWKAAWAPRGRASARAAAPPRREAANATGTGARRVPLGAVSAGLAVIGAIGLAVWATDRPPPASAPREGLLPRGSLLGPADRAPSTTPLSPPSAADEAVPIEEPVALLPTTLPPSPAAHAHAISSEPPGASVVVGGTAVGVTPYTLVTHGDERVDVELRARGRRRAHTTLGPDTADVRVRLAADDDGDYPGLAPR